MRSLVQLFRFLLNVQGAVVCGAEICREENLVKVMIKRRGKTKPRCCMCGARMRGRIREIPASWRHLDLFRTRCELVGAIREGHCPNHGRRQERVPWAEPRAWHTTRFDQAVARMVQVANKTVTSEFFGIAWRTVGTIVKRIVQARLPGNLLDGLTCIGVDETSYKRNHQYLTVVSCLASGRVVWVGEGKSAETLGRFFTQLGPERSRRLKVVAMDLSGAYEKAVREHARQADIVCDRFHVVQLLMKAIDEVRRDAVRKAEPAERRELKGARFALLRNPAHARPGDKAAIAKVKAVNKTLFKAYQLRVDFDAFWDIKDPVKAGQFLIRWAEAAVRSGLEPLRRFAHTLADRILDVLGFHRWDGLTNAVLEGTNNKIKLLIHRAFGFHDVEALMAMIHLCCSGIELEA